jgi:beta-lactamase regulating signal transducer with metallopeptidase domain
MSAMATVFGGPLAQAIGWALLHLLWQGVLVAAILAATLALLKRQSANARYLASCGALLLIVALSFVTAYRAYDPIRGVADTSSSSSPSSEPQTGVSVPTEMSAAADVIIPESSDRLAAIATFANSHLTQIVIAWLIGVTLLASRLLVGWVGANRLAARNTRPAEQQWEIAMQRIAEALQLHRTIRLLESAAVEVPTVIGWLRPVVLLPVASLSGLSTDQIEMILAHELAHVRRHDFIVNLLQSTVETLFFYQPAVWWISRRVRVERENCCDDLAVAVFGDPIRYARALTRFEELRIDAAQTVLAANGGSLLSRIRRLVTSHGESANWTSRWAAGAALLTVIAALVITPSLPLFAKNEPPTPPPAPPATPAATIVEVTPATEAHAAECDAEGDSDDDDAVDIDVDDNDDTDIDVDTDDDDDALNIRAVAAMRPLGAMRVAPVVAVRPMIAPMIQGVTAEAIASAVAEGVKGGIEGGVIGAIAEDLDDDIGEDHKLPENGKLSVDDLIALRTAGVTPKYIEEMRGMGLGNLTLNELRAMRIQGVTPDYIRSLRAAGVEVTNVKTVVGMRIQGVTGDYIAGMRAAGYSKLTTSELIAMRIQGVTPRYVKEMADAGYKGLEARDLIALRIHGVTPEFVKALADAGYANLTAKDLTRLAVSGVNAEFIRDLAKYRTK